MFEAKIRREKLSEVTDVAAALVEEAIIEFGPEGLSMTVVDQANVGMGNVTVPRSDFESYETDGVRLGVYIGKLADVLGMVDADGVVSLELDEETRKLNISADGLSFTMGLIDPDTIKTMDALPEIPFGATVTVESVALTRAVKAADMVSEHLLFTVTDGAFSIEASGDTDDIGYDVSDAHVTAGVDETVADVASRFSLSYLKDMFKAIDGEYVSVSLADDMPVEMEFRLAKSEGTGVFLVAPRISGD